MRIFASALLGLVLAAGYAANGMAEPVGQFTDHRDIGSPKRPGGASYDAKTGTYSVTGGGGNMWADHDAFQFVWKQIPAGDVSLSADLVFTSPMPKPDAPGYVHRKGGLLIRQDLDPDSAYVDVLRMSNQQMSLQYRDVKGGITRLIWINTPYQDRVKLERIGDYAYLSVPGPDGKFRHAGGSFRIQLHGPYLVGLGVCAHDPNGSETMAFRNVVIAPLHAKPGKAETTLQTAVTANGEQTGVINRVGILTAPRWSDDGKTLFFQQGGGWYQVPADGGDATKAQAPKSAAEPAGAWTYTAQDGKLWRARADGSDRTAIDVPADMRASAPQLSPNGKWLVYLATPPTTDARDAELRLLPVADGVPDAAKMTIMARLRAGPNALSPNAWAPDSKSVAFVSSRPAGS